MSSDNTEQQAAQTIGLFQCSDIFFWQDFALAALARLEEIQIRKPQGHLSYGGGAMVWRSVSGLDEEQ